MLGELSRAASITAVCPWFPEMLDAALSPGFVDGTGHADIDLSALHSKRLTVFGVSNKLRTKEQRAAAVPRFAAEILPHFASGRLRPHIDRVMGFAELAQAKARMESGAHIGKIVLRAPASQ